MIAKRLDSIEPSKTLAITSKVIALRKSGVQVLSFGPGEPDFGTPQNIADAAKRAIDEGKTKYTSSVGIIELREAICNKLKRENSVEYSPNEIVVSNGGKHALLNIMLALVNPGDEVLIPVPYWTTYPEQVKLAQGVPVFCETDNLQVTAQKIAEKITAKTKVLILNSPSNPSGAVIAQEELEKIAQLAIKHDFFVVTDDPYEHFSYSGSVTCIASLGEEIKARTIVANTVSKSYAMTGWRIGWSAAPQEITNAIKVLQSQMTSNPCSVSQWAAVEAYNGSQKSVQTMRDEFKERRDYIVAALNACEGISCKMPEGAFYAFPNISQTGLKSEEFATRLLELKHVAVVPGNAFGMDDHVRLSYATSMDEIKKGLALIKEFCEELN